MAKGKLLVNAMTQMNVLDSKKKTMMWTMETNENQEDQGRLNAVSQDSLPVMQEILHFHDPDTKHFRAAAHGYFFRFQCFSYQAAETIFIEIEPP